MSITDELRQQVIEWWGTSANAEILLQMADRIDKAHDKALNDCIHDPAIAADYWEAIIAERYIELPKDKDGKTIHIGDFVRQDNDTYEVIEITFHKIRGYIVVSGAMQDYRPVSYNSSLVELVEPDTQEKIDAGVNRAIATWNVTENQTLSDLEDEIFDLLRRQRVLDGVK